MSKKQLRYFFNQVENCNMCGASAQTAKILGKRLNCSQGKNPKNKTGITTTIVKCTNCDLIYSNPQPIPFDLQDHYGVPPEDYWKPEYFIIDKNYFKNEIEQLKTLMDIKPGMRSLDIGAGLGKAMIALEKAGFDVHGFEPSQQFYERAISKMKIDPTKLQLGMIENINYTEDYFDFISFGAVLEHLYEPSKSIQKALKWLKPNGIIHIEVPSSDWLINKIVNLFYKLKRSDYVANISPMHDPYHLYEFGLKSFKEHANNNGYEIAFHEYYVCQPICPK